MKTLKNIAALIAALTLSALGQTPKKISERTAIAGSAVDAAADVIGIVDTSAGTSGDKKILLSEFVNIPSFFGTVSKAELLYLDGVTSGIQAQLDGKQATLTNTSLNAVLDDDASASRSALAIAPGFDHLTWTAKDLGEARNGNNNAIVRMMMLGDSWTVPSNFDSLLEARIGLFGKITNGVNGGGAALATQYTKYAIGAYSGISITLSATGHTASFGGPTGGRGTPSSRMVIGYRRTPGGGTFQPKLQNAADTNFVNAGAPINTDGGEGIVWEERIISDYTGFAATGTQLRMDWVSGSSEIIGGGMLAGSLTPGTFNRSGVVSYNVAANGSDPSRWDTIPQQSWNSLMSFYKPQLVVIREFRETSISTTDWLNSLSSVITKMQTGRKSGVNAALSILQPGGTPHLTLTAVNAGISGESIRLRFLQAGLSTPLSVSVSGNDITVSLATDGAGTITSTGANIVTAINASSPASALVTASAGSAVAVGAFTTWYPLSCGVGIDFVMVGTHPVDDNLAAHCTASDVALRQFCLDRRIMFVDARSAFPRTFAESFQRGYQDTDGIHLNLSGYRFADKIVGENLRIPEILQRVQYGTQALQPQFYAGNGVTNSWYVNYDSRAAGILPEIGLRRLDAGASNIANHWVVAPLPSDTTTMSNGVAEKITNTTFRQVDAVGRNAFGYSAAITKTIGQISSFVGSTMEVAPIATSNSAATFSGISGQTAPILRVVTGASTSAAGTQVSGYSQLGIPFANLTAYATDAAADADTALPSGGFYTITGLRTVLRKP